MKTSGCIENNNIVAILRSMLYGSLSNIRRLVLIAHGKHRHSLLLTVNLQLLNSCRTVNVTGYKQRLLSLRLKLSRNLGCGSSFTGTLKTNHHNTGNGYTRIKLNLSGLRTHKLNHLFMNNLYNHLSWCKAVKHILSNCPLLNRLDKLLYYLEAYVSL